MNDRQMAAAAGLIAAILAQIDSLGRWIIGGAEDVRSFLGERQLQLPLGSFPWKAVRVAAHSCY